MRSAQWVAFKEQLKSGICVIEQAFLSPQKRNAALTKDLIIKYQFGRLLRHPETNMQW
jgi:hypothetical protein